MKFNSNGVRQWGTYYGGDIYDYGYNLHCDNAGNVYITGCTRSDNAIATIGAYQTVNNGGPSFTDAFLAKFNNNGVRQWGTYYGGSSGDDIGKGITVDNYGNIFVVGQTTSTDAIVTLGAHQTTISGGTYGDIFVAKFLDNTSWVSENNISSSNFNIYPNPVTNELIIECFEKNNNQRFEIINSLGQIVINGIISEKTIISTSELSAGIYVLKLEQNKNFEFKKIIKQ